MRIRGLSMHKFTAHRWYNSRQEKGAGRWAVRGERWKKEEKRWEGRRNNGPSYAARAVLSWSQSLNCGQRPGRAHGNRWIPAPACTLDTPGGERWNAPHLGSGCTGSEVGWKLAGWLRETGLGRASGRGKAWMGHIMGQAHNNSTRAQDEHMQHHITSSITLTMTHATSKTLHEREREKRLTFLSLVLEATSLIISEFPSASPKTHVWLIKPHGLQDLRVHTDISRVPLITLIYWCVPSNEIHKTTGQITIITSKNKNNSINVILAA